ncbi:MAG: hypothetical protein Q7U75_15520 [Desulfobacterales bacterium]|nr:hypothetical protein [Desulfobacterales bacterium]
MHGTPKIPKVITTFNPLPPKPAAERKALMRALTQGDERTAFVPPLLSQEPTTERQRYARPGDQGPARPEEPQTISASPPGKKVSPAVEAMQRFNASTRVLDLSDMTSKLSPSDCNALKRAIGPHVRSVILPKQISEVPELLAYLPNAKTVVACAYQGTRADFNLSKVKNDARNPELDVTIYIDGPQLAEVLAPPNATVCKDIPEHVRLRFLTKPVLADKGGHAEPPPERSLQLAKPDSLSKKSAAADSPAVASVLACFNPETNILDLTLLGQLPNLTPQQCNEAAARIDPNLKEVRLPHHLQQIPHLVDCLDLSAGVKVVARDFAGQRADFSHCKNGGQGMEVHINGSGLKFVDVPMGVAVHRLPNSIPNQTYPLVYCNALDTNREITATFHLSTEPLTEEPERPDSDRWKDPAYLLKFLSSGHPMEPMYKAFKGLPSETVTRLLTNPLPVYNPAAARSTPAKPLFVLIGFKLPTAPYMEFVKRLVKAGKLTRESLPAVLAPTSVNGSIIPTLIGLRPGLAPYTSIVDYWKQHLRKFVKQDLLSVADATKLAGRDLKLGKPPAG